MQPNKQYILGIPIDNITPEETVALVDNAIQKENQVHLEGVNAGKIIDMQKDTKLKESVLESSIITADGQSVIWASILLNKPLKTRVAGIDLMYDLIALAHKKKYTIFFFGAKEEVLQKMIAQLTAKYTDSIIAGYRNGYFKKHEEKEIAQQIAKSKAQLLFVGITSPIKEHFLHEHKEILKNINLIMGVGGSFDVASGMTKRAPLWMQKKGLEWFWRFLQEPKRMWKRYLVGNSKFIQLVIKEKIKS